MGTNVRQNIVTNGLLLYLDAGSKMSYISGSTTWSDLSSNNNSGSLTNGPIFNSTNQGSITFDGTNDYVAMQKIATRLATDNFTMELWCKPTSTITVPAESTSGFAGVTGQRYAIEPFYGDTQNPGAGVSVGTNGIAVVEHKFNYAPALLSIAITLSSTIFSHIVITYTSKQPRAYVNGILVRTGLTSLQSGVDLISNQIGGMGYGYFAGDIANVKWYNRTISDQEVAQNYNATKTRFGLT